MIYSIICLLLCMPRRWRCGSYRIKDAICPLVVPGSSSKGNKKKVFMRSNISQIPHRAPRFPSGTAVWIIITERTIPGFRASVFPYFQRLMYDDRRWL
ncbi:hypothetical protein BDW62DRAFT_141163 [Aspergillus aurantiobrunneus]